MNPVDQPLTLPHTRGGESKSDVPSSAPASGSRPQALPIAPAQSACVTLRAETKSVPIARALVRELLNNYGTHLPEAAETASLLVTELFTNAVVHSNASAVLLALGIRDGFLRIDVADDGSAPRDIRERPTSAFDENGRGLLLVRALSQSWGRETASFGTKVWAVLPLVPQV